jgi:phosphatidylinositol alpha 1,6-mannosyltransferase
LARDRELLKRMRAAARANALTCSWDAVFTRVYEGYRDALPPHFREEEPAAAKA